MRMWSKYATGAAFGGLCAVVALVHGGCGGIVDEAAEKQFKQDLGTTSITVFPAAVRRDKVSYDPNAARQLGDFLKERKLADATVSDADVPLTGPWHANEAKMWRESAAALAAYVKDHPIQTQYAVLPEYLFLGGKGTVGGVHVYVVDKDGRVAAGALLNSHHRPFADAKPKTVEDCTALLIKVIGDEWNAKPAP